MTTVSISDNRSEPVLDKNAGEIPKYTYFTGELQNRKGLFYKSFDTLHFLSDNPTSWNREATAVVVIADYRPIEAIRLEVLR